MNRTEIETKVTDAVIARLEQGVAPWRRPWTTAGWLPTSVATGKPYRGINSLLLSAVAEQSGYESPLWATFRQIDALGGKVVKGEKATPIVFWKMLRKEEEVAGKVAVQTIPLMKYFNVFNIAQTEGVDLPSRFQTKREPVEVIDGVKQVIDGYVDGPTLDHAPQGRAFYRPSEDRVVLPALEQFETAEGYAETLFHEFTHSTGHASRLDRFGKDNAEFGCEGYAKEELVAEMGAALLAATVGVNISLDNAASYVGNWLSTLKDDRSLIIKAAQQAQKAVDRIIGYDPAAEAEKEKAA
jgi:antirestriction protein ArdC